MRRSSNQDGFVFPFVVLAMAAGLGAFYLLAIVTSELTQASQAQTAADAAALAAASAPTAEGRSAARRAAEANGAEVVKYDRHIHSKEVAEAIFEGATMGKGGKTGAKSWIENATEDEERDVTVTVRIGKHVAQARAQRGDLVE